MALRAAAEKGLEGTYHVTNQGSCSWLEFAEKILELAGKKGVEVEPISSEELGRPAPRPGNSVLDCGKFEKAAGMQLRGWPEALKDYLFG
jgi:dTDP-4-dehydrorhamnose reductase